MEGTLTSRPTEGNAKYFNSEDDFWWRYKSTHPVEYPEPGRGIEEYFVLQNFNLKPPLDFAPSKEMTLTLGGDIMPVVNYKDSVADHLWDDVEEFFFSADAVCANLEAPLSETEKSDVTVFPPRLINDPWWFDKIWRNGNGVNIFSTANNHALDLGREGAIKTLNFLDKCKGKGKIYYTGSAANARDSILVVNFGGVNVGFIAWTFSLNSQENPAGEEFLVNHLRVNTFEPDITRIVRDAAAARKQGADVVVLMLHWGLEFESFPIQRFIDTGHRLIEAGVDVIAGNHAHGLQPVEVHAYTDKVTGEAKKGVIFYALGDLVSFIPAAPVTVPNERLCAVARLCVQKGLVGGLEKTYITGVETKPLYAYVKLGEGEGLRRKFYDYRLLDIRGLAQRLYWGTETLPFTDQEKSEVFRLFTLAKRVLPRGGTTPWCV